MKFRFHPEALAEFRGAAQYYAATRQPLGLEFADVVETSIRRIADAPLACAILEYDVRRCVVHTFPYAVLYTVEPDYVLIVAVMHGHRKPGYWHYRVGIQT